MITRYPRLQRSSEALRHRFDFEHDTLLVDGVRFTVLVTVYSMDDYELWNLDADRPVAFEHLPKKDQRAILDKVCDRFRRDESPTKIESIESRREIAELNNVRGVR